MGRLRVGVAGAGHIGRLHARVLSSIEAVELVAVYDVDNASARRVAAECGVRPAESIEDLAGATDAVTVATPTPTHRAVAGRLLELGRHVLVEKPIASTLDEARELVARAREAGLVLQVGHVERFNPVLAYLERVLTRPRFIEAHRLSPYPGRSTEIGVVLDLMIHDLEIVLHLVRSPLVAADAVGVPVLSGSEDIANARLRFACGCVANITASRVSPERMRKIRVFQADAYLSLDYMAQSGETHRIVQGHIEREPVAVEPGEPLRLELAAWARCCTEGGEPRVTGREAAAALALAVALAERIGTGGGAIEIAEGAWPGAA